jgi:hypothetical protein
MGIEFDHEAILLLDDGQQHGWRWWRGHGDGSILLLLHQFLLSFYMQLGHQPFWQVFQCVEFVRLDHLCELA